MEYKVKRDAEKAYIALVERGFDFNNMDTYQPAVKALAEEIFLSVDIHEEAEEENILPTIQRLSATKPFFISGK